MTKQIEIANLLLRNELLFLQNKGYSLMPDNSVLPFLVQRGFHPKLGARPMRDAIEKLLGDAISQNLLANKSASGFLTVDDSEMRLAIEPLGSDSHFVQKLWEYSC